MCCASATMVPNWPPPHQSGRAERGLQPQHWMECRRHRTGPDSDEIPRRRRTGLARDNQTDLDSGTCRPGERSRAACPIQGLPLALSGDFGPYNRIVAIITKTPLKLRRLRGVRAERRDPERVQRVEGPRPERSRRGAPKLDCVLAGPPARGETMSRTDGNATERNVTLHVVSSLDGFIAKKDNSVSWL